MKQTKYYNLLLTFVAIALGSPALASSSCRIVSIVNMNFSSYDVFSYIPNDSLGSITLNCSEVQTITITIDKGSSTTYNSRTMSQLNYILNYNLYLDASRVTVWGDGTGGSSQYGPASIANNANFTVNIYGRIPARQTQVAGGNYTDFVNFTIIY